MSTSNYGNLSPDELTAMHKAGLLTKQSLRLRRVEQIALAAGLVLTGLSGTVRIHQAVISRAMMARFRAENPKTLSGIVDPDFTSQVDFRLWSANRIAAYKQSLMEKTDMPIGILHIPRIHLETPVFGGTDELTLNRGVGRISSLRADPNRDSDARDLLSVLFRGKRARALHRHSVDKEF